MSWPSNSTLPEVTSRKPDQQAPCVLLPAAGFAYQGQGLPLVNFQVHIGHPHVPPVDFLRAADGEFLYQMLGAQQKFLFSIFSHLLA